MACPACGCKETYQYNDGEDYDLGDELIRCAACGAIFELDDEAPEEDDDLASPPKRRVKCAGGRTEHTMEPEWKGNGFTHLKCRWCGKREAN